MRERRPTDDQRTTVRDPRAPGPAEAPGSPSGPAAPPAAAPAKSTFVSFEDDVTRAGMGVAAGTARTGSGAVAAARQVRSVDAGPTRLERPRAGDAGPTLVDPPRDEAGVPVEARTERSEPLRVISMKDHSAEPRRAVARAPLHVQLRSLAEVSGRHDTPPAGMGNLAPPRDSRQARARRVRDYLGWACVAIVLAAAISLAIWLAAGY